MKKLIYLEDNIEFVLRGATIGQSFDIGEFENEISNSDVYDEMVELDLIKKINDTTYALTELGNKTKQAGGYAEKAKEKKVQKLKEFAEISNLDIQLKLNHHQYKTRWIAYISIVISIIAIVISVIQLNKPN